MMLFLDVGMTCIVIGCWSDKWLVATQSHRMNIPA